MEFATVASPGLGVYAKMKLAQLFSMPEKEVAERVKKLESDGLFKRLLDTGVVSLEPYPKARFAVRDCEVTAPCSDGLPELEDAEGDLSGLIERIGQDRFESCFLHDDSMPDEARTQACGITMAEARRLRRYLDELALHAEFVDTEGSAAASRVYSVVAGIEMEGGRPVLGFFHRDVWKGRYRIDPDRRRSLLASMPEAEARRAERLLSQLEWLDRRKSTLYRVLEALLETQADYLASEDPDRRHAITQRSLAARVGIGPDVLNRLISNKSVRLPWGRETVLKTLVPSAKTLLRDRLFDLAMDQPEASDSELAGEMNRRYGANLSRWSVMKYRQELRLDARGRRGKATTAKSGKLTGGRMKTNKHAGTPTG